MKNQIYQTRCRRAVRILFLGTMLFWIAGCEQTPGTANADNQGGAGESPAAADSDAVPSQPVTEPRPAMGPEGEEAETKKVPVDPEALWGASLDGNIEGVRQAIDSGVNVDAADDQNRTALLLAAFNGHTEVVKLLKLNGALMNHRDIVGRTALMFAATGANAETVKFLLESGAEVNAVDTDEKFTALMHAAAEGQTKVVEILLKHKADPGLRDIDGDTALVFAKNNGHADVIRLLSK